MKTLPTYFDYAATTPVDKTVIDAMVACLGTDGTYGNPASNSHVIGVQANALVETARRELAKSIGALASEIFWTSGATESINLALKGFAQASKSKKHIITSVLEHKATLDTAAWLETQGIGVSYIVPAADGTISAAAIEAAMRPDTALVSLMWVNNELGTITDIAAISRVAHAHGAVLHVDGAQALGKLDIDVERDGIDMLSMSAHKIYGPKGIGALYLRSNLLSAVVPLIHGGGHERGVRSGTLPTHQIVGMGRAVTVAEECRAAEWSRIATLHQRLMTGLRTVGIQLNAEACTRVPHTLSLTVHAEHFLPFVIASDLAVSSTSACNSASGAVSHVLLAMGLSEEEAVRTIRISIGKMTSEADIDAAVRCLTSAFSAMPQDRRVMSLSFSA